MNIHDIITDNLENLINRDFDDIELYRNVEYGIPARVIGEIDLFFYEYKTNDIWLFEVKTTVTKSTYKKALSQLNRHKKIFIKDYFEYNVNNIYTYIVTKTGKKNYNPKLMLIEAF